MNLTILCNIFGGRPHPKKLVTMKELLQVPIISKKSMKEEKEKSKNLGFPFLPAIYKASPKKEK